MLTICALTLLAATDAEVRQSLERVLPPDLALVSLAAPPPFVARAPAGSLRAEWPSAPRAGSGRVILYAGAEKAWATVVLEALAEVPVARRSIARGERVEARDFVLARRPQPSGTGLRAEAWLGLPLREDLAAGAALERRHVDLPAPLPRGTPVSVVVTRSGLELSATGILEQAAELGGAARVRVESSGRVLRGFLTRLDTVELTEGAR